MDPKDYFEEVLTRWETQLREYIDDFERYSRAMSELDTTLFEYVTKLDQCRQDQDDVEMKQQDIMKKVQRVEAKQTAMMDIITTLQQKVGDRDSEIETNLEKKAQDVNKTIRELESNIIELGGDIDRLEQEAYDENFGELVHSVNIHSRILAQIQDQMSV